MDTPRLDTLDRLILKYLQEDGRTPFTTIANAAGVAEGTIRKRYARLVEKGLAKVVAVVNPEGLGLKTRAIVGIEVEGEQGEEVATELAKLPEVRYVAISAGEHDLIIEVVVASNEELYKFLTKRLREIKGVKSSDTSMIMKTSKEAYTWSLKD
ncbi:MAG: Lrp/AsnC family transcriptional regulator [Firmicutes bacterium]|nr:Lrp/AsnC family transcriptional regulator [Bacillota bacterium]